MKFRKTYDRTIFPASVVAAFYAEFNRLVHDEKLSTISALSVDRPSISWSYDVVEEFYAEYDQGFDSAQMAVWNHDSKMYFGIHAGRGEASVCSGLLSTYKLLCGKPFLNSSEIWMRVQCSILFLKTPTKSRRSRP